MGTIGGNNSVQDGLVFHYDTGNRLKSFMGEPTVNLVINPTLEKNGSNEYLPYTRIETIFDTHGVGVYSFSFDIKTQVPGNISCYTADGTGRKYGFSTIGVPATTEWKRFYGTREVTLTESTSGYNNLSFYGTYNTGRIPYVKNVQIEKKGYSTPFTPTSRLVTQSLYDLTDNTSINLGNVSFDTNAHPYFDGTDRRIITNWGNGVNPSITPFTVEAIVKQDDLTGNRMWLDTAGQGTDQRFYSSLNTVNRIGYGIQNNTWNGGIPDTNYHHQTIVMDGTQAIAYDNGVEVYRRNYTSYTLVNNIEFGSRAGAEYFWLGQIPIAKIYNKALTPQEVKNNFNSVRSRFGI